MRALVYRGVAPALASLLVSCAAHVPNTSGRLSVDAADWNATADSIQQCLLYPSKTLRVRVDKRRVGVQLGGCVSGADVVMIVQAIHRNEWVNQQAAGSPMPHVDLGHPLRVTVPLAVLHGVPYEPSMYYVWTPEGTHPNGSSGQTILVVIRSGRVGVRAAGSWES